MEDHFSADFHWRHGNILKHSKRLMFMSAEERKIVESGSPGEIERLRIGRDSTDRMNDHFIDKINAQVKPEDRLWFLGDWYMCGRRDTDDDIFKVFSFYRRKIQCRNVIMIWGNHDPQQESTARNLVRVLFSKCYDKHTARIQGQKIQMNHEALAIWEQRHHGGWHLYGHSHSNAEKWLDEIMPGRWSLDVGVDNAFKLLGDYRPFTFPEVKDIFAKRPGFGLLSQRSYHHGDD